MISPPPFGGVGQTLGQLLSKTSGNKTETFTYDKLGNVTQTVDESGTTTYTYDTLGRLTEESRNDGIKKQYTYDANNNRKTFRLVTDFYDEQQNLSYNYDKLNRLRSMTEDGLHIASYGYDKNSQITSSISTVIESYYDRNLAGLVTGKSSRDYMTYEDFSVNNYTYYADGNVKTENGKTYTYDAQNRLSNVAEGTDNTAYTFDLRGNRINKTGGKISDKVYDKNNHLISYTYVDYDLPYNVGLYYDVRGNLYWWSVAEEEEIWDIERSYLYYYDGFNRMSEFVADYAGYGAEYEYNSSGLRTSKTLTDGYYSDELVSITTKFIYDGVNIIAEITDGEVTNYIRGADGILFRRTPDGEETYYATNAHGDVTNLVSRSCDVIQTYTYDEYGNVTSSTGNDPNPFLYCGEYYDWESGLIYLRARYYSPELGRFITEDPIRDDLNWYAYCGSNPVNAWDPSGKTWYGFDPFLSESDQRLIEYYTEQYNKYGENDVILIHGLYEVNARHHYHQAAMEVRNNAIDAQYLKWAQNDFKTFGITPENVSELGYNNYYQALYEHAMSLQNDVDEGIDWQFVRDNQGVLKESFLKFAGFASNGRPKSNTAQNNQSKAIVKKYNLSKEGQELLHRRAGEGNYGWEELCELAEEIVELGGKYVK